MSCRSTCTKCGHSENHECSGNSGFISQMIKGKQEKFCRNCVSEALIGYFGGMNNVQR
ncbi:MAG: hypothetical protein K5790_10305 [Nitrosopumilus sp.]|uniref:hypothetical protein n=1 Tax=Nitrosopumilus sp. TaxID=2024843 RepID=UPI00247BCE59|nr:hypothetical protein [Nitrosopumilus sp.]MCV0393661.1 hypothetical protein [Nitrosopumilus sp.]